jgi:hypothetical protein
VKDKLQRLVRLFTAWAWRDEIERRYTVQEVTAWLAEYHGRYREIPMTLWIQMQRDKANAGIEFSQRNGGKLQ